VAGDGVFASIDIESGEFLLDYVGRLISNEEAGELDDQTYVFSFQIGPLLYR